VVYNRIHPSKTPIYAPPTAALTGKTEVSSLLMILSKTQSNFVYRIIASFVRSLKLRIKSTRDCMTARVRKKNVEDQDHLLGHQKAVVEAGVAAEAEKETIKVQRIISTPNRLLTLNIRINGQEEKQVRRGKIGNYS